MILRIAVRIQTLEWDRRSHWYKNVCGNAVPTQKYLWERRSHAFPHQYTPGNKSEVMMAGHRLQKHWHTSEKRSLQGINTVEQGVFYVCGLLTTDAEV